MVAAPFFFVAAEGFQIPSFEHLLVVYRQRISVLMIAANGYSGKDEKVVNPFEGRKWIVDCRFALIRYMNDGDKECLESFPLKFSGDSASPR